MPDFSQIKLVLFDLDGTLVDSVGDLAWCANEMLRRLDMAPVAPEAASRFVGNGVERFVKRVLTNDMNAEPDAALYASGYEIFNSLYVEYNSVHSKVFGGAIECLQALSRINLHLACVTNKAERFTTSLVASMGLADYFQLVVSGDTTAQKKPHPMPLHYAASHFGLDSHECLMVGDSKNDVIAARAAGFAVVCVPYGYNHGEDISEAGPDRVIDNLAELGGLFE